ncbi:carboxypeptidase-like regulatory domain-containing protein [Fodinibius sediminis]|uniref:carboxypeptidase-like regulatory domain-containing protein n=1 Tax=Fodinibius sediminis TaxID=1214077 RepID=UPI001158C99D|nr:carboxypeptidase-like regulatory domain-containing protein [Fodinibius sediminis]
MNSSQQTVTQSLSTLTFVLLLGGEDLAQTGTIQGRVIKTDWKPIPDINLHSEDTRCGSLSDALGYYTLKNIPAGVYSGWSPASTAPTSEHPCPWRRLLFHSGIPCTADMFNDPSSLTSGTHGPASLTDVELFKSP